MAEETTVTTNGAETTPATTDPTTTVETNQRQQTQHLQTEQKVRMVIQQHQPGIVLLLAILSGLMNLVWMMLQKNHYSTRTKTYSRVKRKSMPI